MTLFFQKFINREDLRANPDVLYLFGDNDQRAGYGGQAAEMRGEPNAIGVRTKHRPSRDLTSAFWSDSEHEKNRIKIDNDLYPVWKHMESGGHVVCPLDGLGTGLSDLNNRAPKTFAYLCERIDNLKWQFATKKGK